MKVISKLSFSYHCSQCLTIKANGAGYSIIKVEDVKSVRPFCQSRCIVFLFLNLFLPFINQIL